MADGFTAEDRNVLASTATTVVRMERDITSLWKDKVGKGEFRPVQLVAYGITAIMAAAVAAMIIGQLPGGSP